MFDVFRASYGDDELAKMLQAAKKVDSTEDVATNMQKAQFTQCG